MAEFCLDCWNRINETNHGKDRYIISEDLDLCEGCGEMKHIIIMKNDWTFMQLFKSFFGHI